MINAHFNTIDPTNTNIPNRAVVLKVNSEEDRLPNGEHERAARAFLLSDGIASGIGKDLAFVDKIPQFINEIIDNKSWEYLYVAKGVATPYYCRYTKGTESENFRAFITAKRPNGLETSVEILDRVLQADLEVQRKFRAIIYESRQGQRADLVEKTSHLQDGKLKSAQQERIRAANRAAEAIPEIGELLDRGLIAIELAAKLGRELKDPDNLTAEEREYIDKRDLIRIRLKQYINTNIIPEDEDKEPAYTRELNRYVKDLLGIKDRSKSVRMDHPKKAAEKLLTFYKGEQLKALVEYLSNGLNRHENPDETATTQNSSNGSLVKAQNVSNKTNDGSSFEESNSTSFVSENNKPSDHFNVEDILSEETSDKSLASLEKPFFLVQTDENTEDLISQEILKEKSFFEGRLNVSELAQRLGRKPRTIQNMMYNHPEQFMEWTKEKDPDGIAWQKSEQKLGKSYLFFPIQENSI